MNFMHIIGLLLFIKSTLAVSEADTKLVLVQSAYRHGVRSAYLDYPNDKVKQALWTSYGGLAQLTPVGMRQMYQYGQFLRNKYQNFLNPTYDRTRVYARSTDYDRTLQTSYVLLAGLFRPNQVQNWADQSSGIANWLPIPVHTANLTDDQILNANAPCPRYDQLREEARNSSEFLQLQTGNQDFINLMMNYSGLTGLNYYTMWKIADKAMVEEAHNLTIDKYIQDNYDKIMQINDDNFYFDFVTIEMAKLISGALLNNIINNIKSKISSSSNKLELYLFGVHDNYIAGLQKLLNTSTKFVQPNFGANYIFELRNDTAGKYYVQVLYKNNKNPFAIDLVPIKLYGCDQICPLDQFLALTADKTLWKFNDACKIISPTTPSFVDTIVSWITNFFNIFKM